MYHGTVKLDFTNYSTSCCLELNHSTNYYYTANYFTHHSAHYSTNCSTNYSAHYSTNLAVCEVVG